jgi:N-glycosylase/DNA lyase
MIVLPTPGPNALPAIITRRLFPVVRYDLESTLNSGQAFRWERNGKGCEGVIGNRWVRLSATPAGLVAEVLEPVTDWSWLSRYLQLDLDYDEILRSFPDDEPMREAVRQVHGLRLLRQDPWECLASFLLSSTKQIVQIRQIVARLCQCHGNPVPAPPGSKPAFSFPDAEQLARVSEAELRDCRMGFRAGYLRTAALRVAGGNLDLAALFRVSEDEARALLMELPGVGRKIADCVLLFAYGFPRAFPIDVWVLKALRALYFDGRVIPQRELQTFATAHFGPQAGYAQQYLFHYMRTRGVQPAG